MESSSSFDMSIFILINNNDASKTIEKSKIFLLTFYEYLLYLWVVRFKPWWHQWRLRFIRNEEYKQRGFESHSRLQFVMIEKEYGMRQTKSHMRWRWLLNLSVFSIHIDIPLLPRKIREKIAKKVSDTAQY